jgi:hypothetical protein
MALCEYAAETAERDLLQIESGNVCSVVDTLPALIIFPLCNWNFVKDGDSELYLSVSSNPAKRDDG